MIEFASSFVVDDFKKGTVESELKELFYERRNCTTAKQVE